MEWIELRNDINEIFTTKSEKLGLNPKLELQFIEDAPIDGEFVYGEAFPNENRVWLEVVAPEASDEEILEILCHELVHLKHPELDHDSKNFEAMVKQYMKV